MKIEDIQLRNTVNMMISDDYQDRFRAEFWQTLIRYRKLSTMLADWDISPFVHKTDRKTLERQAELLAGLLYIYMKRAVQERVDLFVGDFSVHYVYQRYPKEPEKEEDPIEQLRKLSKDLAERPVEPLSRRYPVESPVEKFFGNYDPLVDRVSQAEEEILGSIDRGKKS